MRIVEHIRIERSPGEVWAVVSDLSTHVDWRPALVEFRQVSEGPLAVGSRIREVLSWRGRELVLDDVVTALEPGRHFGITGGWKAAEFDLDLRLEPVGDGETEVTFDWPLRPKSALLKIATPFLKGAMQRATAEEAQLLKEYVETRSPGSG
ncbi:MAG TPA: SRPBCC family protein [Gaiellaceae bacterium]|nr:SRPBCC family protein [Gaiellaceae bacterium]